MSAFPESGCSFIIKFSKMTGSYRPEADVWSNKKPAQCGVSMVDANFAGIRTRSLRKLPLI